MSTQSTINPHDHIGLARKEASQILRAYPRHNLEYDEVLSELYFVLENAARKFDPSKGYKFSTYAVACFINTRPRTLVRSKNFGTTSYKRAAFNMRCSAEYNDRWMTQAAEEQLNEVDLQDLAHLMDQCDERELDAAVSNISRGETLKQIGERLEISKERVRQLRNRALKSMRESAGMECAS